MTAVIVFHCGLMPFGWMGVWLFYVVSGFSVATSVFASRRTDTPGGAAFRFYVRRARRIWPLYYVFVALNGVLLMILGWRGPLEDVPWLLTFTYNLKMIFTVYTSQTTWASFQHLWTLSVEQHFYLVFPLLLLLRGRAARSVALLGLIVLAPVIRALVGQRAASLGWDAERCAFAVYAFAPAHFDAFAAGTLIALFRERIAADRRIARIALVASVLICAAYIAVYVTLGLTRAGLSVDSVRNVISGVLFGAGREIFIYYLPASVGVAFLAGILAGERPCLRLCRLPGMQAIGRVSYGGYVLHVPVLLLLGFLVPAFTVPITGPLSFAAHIAKFVCAYPLVVGVAWLSLTFFERRFAGPGRRMESPARAARPVSG